MTDRAARRYACRIEEQQSARLQPYIRSRATTTVTSSYLRLDPHPSLASLAALIAFMSVLATAAPPKLCPSVCHSTVHDFDVSPDIHHHLLPITAHLAVALNRVAARRHGDGAANRGIHTREAVG